MDNITFFVDNISKFCCAMERVSVSLNDESIQDLVESNLKLFHQLLNAELKKLHIEEKSTDTP